MTGSKIFLYFCLAFIGGIFLSSFLPVVALAKAGLVILGIMIISVFWGRRKFALIGFCFLFFILGVWRHESAQSKIIYPEEKNIVFSGIVAAEPDIRSNHIKLTIKSDENSSRLKYDENSSRLVEGKVLVTTERYPEYRYGDKLKITGRIETPKELEDFNYPEYLAKDGIYSIIYYPEIELIGENHGNVIYTGILSFKDKLRNVIYQNLSPPQSSILAAIILGDKRQISDEWKEKLNFSGVRHLTAISGMHVAVLTVILMSFLVGLGFWRRQAFYSTVILITLFIITTGLQPSAIRAGIMGGIFLFARYLGRKNLSSRAIFFAAVLMLAYNPLLLRLDAGFQLSFLAMLGIIYLLPVFQQLLFKVSVFLKNNENKFFSFPVVNDREMKNVLAMTLSAQVFTLPILIYNFGYFSTVAPLTNLIIVPLLPFIMGLGLVFVLLGTVWSFLGWLFSWPVWLLLTYLMKIVDWFSSFSFSAYMIEISWVWLVISYLILILIVWRLNKKFATMILWE